MAKLSNGVSYPRMKGIYIDKEQENPRKKGRDYVQQHNYAHDGTQSNDEVFAHK